MVYVKGVRSVNALTLRQSLGRVLRQLERAGEPIMVERAKQPAAVLISLQGSQQRFVGRAAEPQRGAIVDRLKALRFRAPAGRTTTDELRNVRSGRR